MTVHAAILKAHSSKSTARRIQFSELTEFTQSQYGTFNFEPLNLASKNQSPKLIEDVRLESAIRALNDAAAQLSGQRDSWIEQCQRETIELGIAIAERLLRKTLTTNPSSVIELVRSAFDWCLDAEHLRVRLNPDDAKQVASSSEKLQHDAIRNLEFIPDESLSRGDCILETSNGQVDARIETILDRVAEELLGGD